MPAMAPPPNRYRLSAWLVRWVHPDLEDRRCMWFEDGDESQRCEEEASWTYGMARRIYCDEHARLLVKRYKRDSQRESRRRKRLKETKI